jgi:Holliday junction resolvasome RuvABC endonuclease subunit
MITLGFDPSITGYGWCVHDSEAQGEARVVGKGVWKSSPKTVFVRRYMDFRDLVAKKLDEYPQVEAIGVESPVFGEQWSPGAYALFVYTNEVVYSRRKDVVYFDPGTVKMLTKIDPKVRKGKMFKQDMVAAAREDTGIKGRFNHNEADAYHVARFTARFFQRFTDKITDSDLTPSEYKAFSKVIIRTRGENAGQVLRTGAIFKEHSRFHRFSQLEAT